jgi:uncharacterized protein YbjT (DUF2867 family)
VILVIGGRSKIGSAVIAELLARGEVVRALGRDSEGTGGFPEAVEVAIGDLADVQTLRTAMNGVAKVFLLAGPHEGEVTSNRNAIDAARDAGVQLLVRSSIIGSHPDSLATFVRDHGICDSYLRDSGLPNVIVRPNLFLQNVPQNNLPSIGADGNLYVNAGDARISMVDTRDVAAVAAVALTEPGHVGATYDVTGPAALSYEDVATAASGILGRRITYVDVPDEAVRESLAGFGLGAWMVNGLVDLYQDYRRSGIDGYAAVVSDSVQRVAGRAPRSLDELLAEQPLSTRS